MTKQAPHPAGPCLAVLLLLPAAPQAQAPSPEDGRRYDEIRASLYEATNRWREGESVGSLVRDTRIDELIQRHVEDKAACGYYYGGGAHASCDGTEFGSRIGSYFSGRGLNQPSRSSENMGLSSATGMGIVQPAIDGWANSPGHRANMIDASVGVMGIGYAEGFIGEISGGRVQACTTSAARNANGYFVNPAMAAEDCATGSLYGQVFASVDPEEEGFYSAMTRMAQEITDTDPPDPDPPDPDPPDPDPPDPDPPDLGRPSGTLASLFDTHMNANLEQLDQALAGLYVYHAMISRILEQPTAPIPAGWPAILARFGFTDIDAASLSRLADSEELQETHDRLDPIITRVVGTVTDALSATMLIRERIQDGELAPAEIAELQEALEIMEADLLSLSPGRYDAATRSARRLSLSAARVATKRLARLRQGEVQSRDAARGEASTPEPQTLVATTAEAAELTTSMGLARLPLRTTRYQGEGLASWVQAYGSVSYQNEEHSLQAYDQQQHGILVGADRFFQDRWIAGAYVGGGEMDTSYENDDDRHDASQLSFGMYGMLLPPSRRSYVEMAIGAHLLEHRQRREIRAAGPDAIRAKYDSLAFSAHTGGGMLFNLRHLIVEPELTLEYIYHDVSGFSESGTSPLRLTVGDQESQNLNARVGINLYQEFTSAKGYLFVPRIGFHYLSELSLGDRDIPARFAVVPGSASTFVLQGREGSRNYYQHELGLQVTSSDGRLQAHGDYALIIGNRLEEHQFQIGLRYRFD